MLPTNNETDTLKLIKREKNSAYETEEAGVIYFKGRPANNAEKRNFRLLKGVHGNEESIYIYCSNLPNDVKVGDTIEFRGSLKFVESIGYYYNESRVLNASIMNDDYLIARSPKGISLK